MTVASEYILKPIVEIEPMKPELPEYPVSGFNEPVIRYLMWWLENKLPDHEDDFCMRDVCGEMSCGTVRCLLGWAIYLWGMFDTTTIFGIKIYTPFDLKAPLYDRATWCFCAEWENVDNSVEGAICRLELMLQDKVPINWKEQMYGYAPITYMDLSK